MNALSAPIRRSGYKCAAGVTRAAASLAGCTPYEHNSTLKQVWDYKHMTIALAEFSAPPHARTISGQSGGKQDKATHFVPNNNVVARGPPFILSPTTGGDELCDLKVQQVRDELLEEIEEMKKMIKKESIIREKMDSIRANEIEKLNRKIGGIHQSLSPAILQSLCEEVVDEMLKECYEIYPESERGRVKYNYQQMAISLLKTLLDDSDSDRGALAFNINKVCKEAEKNAGYTDRSSFGIKCLIAITAFLESVKDIAKDWPPSRSPLVHGGGFLDCLFKSSLFDDTHWCTEEKIGEFRKMITEKCLELQQNDVTTVDDGFKLLLDSTLVKDTSIEFVNVELAKQLFHEAMKIQ